ncbi:4Fe-4S dicluster domain-containing protein [Acidianus sulfidivorans JP7]|uniref:4Fe-4S ferredoxin n=1 Tax=Acidianus sulfidivorans JP7 TaxID=619593 RepID=A0A2U9IJG5_9CREN|nr:DmsC/YnfH family molybdoenzyme membrane anchor subunit [Acidianus sulfidivorans]AWR96181.1 4Fe-4S dicluster domain-containing protein [Acidianus sulfidivorans JP7]
MERESLGFIFDPNKCIICNACVNACNQAYGGLNWRELPIFQIDGTKVAISIACNHCDNPECMNVCPANAIHKDDMGIVYINKDECIGCGYCTWACPYEEPKFNSEGIMTKCHFCRERILNKQGLPLCVEACPTGALAFGWIKKPEYNGDNFLAPYDITRPKIEIKKTKEGEIKANPLKVREEKRHSELLLFTILSEISLGYLAVKAPYYQIVSLILLAIGLIPSIFHINRKERALRVIMNLKSSWLSREVLFGSLALLSMLIELGIPDMYYLSIILLAISIISSIMIYLLKSTPSWYNIDTPISFLGTIFVVSFPLGFFLTHSILYLIVAEIISVLEIFSGLNNKYNKDFRIINIGYIIVLGIALIVPILSIVSSIVGVASEVMHREKFFKKVTYYGIPNIE